MFKRAILLATVIIMATFSVAYAGYGVHKTVDGSDVCPICHEHKPIGNVWQSHQSVEYQFCTTCHGIATAGADTDVVSGVYDNPQGTTGTFGQALNSGGFEKIGGPNGRSTTSTHSVDGTIYPIFGNSSGNTIGLTCTSCHDPEGSTNYRLLKDVVNGKDVSNYVESNETNFADSLSNDETIYKNYVPNYTTPNYKAPADLAKGLSGWCAACHDNYKSNTYEVDPKNGRKHYYYIDAQGQKRFRHAVNVTIGNNPSHNTNTNLPLAKIAASSPDNDPSNLVICLTCHRVHGTDAIMTDKAKVEPTLSAASSGPGQSALLRFDNRGVCEDCHKK